MCSRFKFLWFVYLGGIFDFKHTWSLNNTSKTSLIYFPMRSKRGWRSINVKKDSNVHDQIGKIYVAFCIQIHYCSRHSSHAHVSLSRANGTCLLVVISSLEWLHFGGVTVVMVMTFPGRHAGQFSGSSWSVMMIPTFQGPVDLVFPLSINWDTTVGVLYYRTTKVVFQFPKELLCMFDLGKTNRVIVRIFFPWDLPGYFLPWYFLSIIRYTCC